MHFDAAYAAPSSKHDRHGALAGIASARHAVYAGAEMRSHEMALRPQSASCGA
jgi:hypothetical protein